MPDKEAYLASVERAVLSRYFGKDSLYQRSLVRVRDDFSLFHLISEGQVSFLFHWYNSYLLSANSIPLINRKQMVSEKILTLITILRKATGSNSEMLSCSSKIFRSR